MPRPTSSRKRSAARSGRSAPLRQAGRKRRKRRLPSLWPSAATRGRLLRRFRCAPLLVQALTCIVLLIAGALLLNGVYQVMRKPSELFFPVSGTLYKAPKQTWKSYGPLFERHATATITPEFLAALAQIEGSGNPIVRTYWKFDPALTPLDMYRPASSAVGMYQITDGTFAEARRYCIHAHAVAAAGPWNDLHSCWFNSLYTRTIPSHAVELTSAYLDRKVAEALGPQALARTDLARRHELAAVIHLCGAGAGRRYVRLGMRLTAGQRCGDHAVARYLEKLRSTENLFAQLRHED